MTQKGLSLHERFSQDWIRTRERSPGEGRLPTDGLPVEITREGGALYRQPAGNVSRGQLHHQPGGSQGEAGVAEVLGVTREVRDLQYQGFSQEE